MRRRRSRSMMRGAQPYDADAVSEAAGIIRSHAGDALTDLFPEGSLNHPSEAKPDIWTDWSEFEALATRLADVATGLEMAAGNGLSGDSASAGALAGLTPETNVGPSARRDFQCPCPNLFRLPRQVSGEENLTLALLRVSTAEVRHEHEAICSPDIDDGGARRSDNGCTAPTACHAAGAPLRSSPLVLNKKAGL